MIVAGLALVMVQRSQRQQPVPFSHKLCRSRSCQRRGSRRDYRPRPAQVGQANGLTDKRGRVRRLPANGLGGAGALEEPNERSPCGPPGARNGRLAFYSATLCPAEAPAPSPRGSMARTLRSQPLPARRTRHGDLAAFIQVSGRAPSRSPSTR